MKIRDFAIEVGRPLVANSFPGPDAHKLTPDEYAYEIGRVMIAIELGFAEPIVEFFDDRPTTNIKEFLE